jgi:hypothetical protein
MKKVRKASQRVARVDMASAFFHSFGMRSMGNMDMEDSDLHDSTRTHNNKEEEDLDTDEWGG